MSTQTRSREGATAARFTWQVLAVLVAATAVGPFAMQIFLPALPAIQTAFSVNAAMAQSVFSASLLAIAVSTLFYGPLSDRWGRRPILIIGVVLFVAGSLLCSFAASIWSLLIGRLLQAAGGCAGVVLSRAVVRDLLPQEQAAGAIGYITTAMIAVPMFAPALGGWLTDSYGWQSVFLASVALGLAVLAASLLRMPETRAPSVTSAGYRALFGAFPALLRKPAFLSYGLHSAFSVASFFSFLGGTPYVVITIMGEPPSLYGTYFIFIAAAFMLGNFLAGRIRSRIGLACTIVLASAGSVLGTSVCLGFFVFGVWTPWALFVPMMFTTFVQGVALPNAQAAIVSVDPEAAGAASGLGGFLQMGLGALAAQVVGSMQFGSPLPMAVGIWACTCAMLLFGLWAVRQRV